MSSLPSSPARRTLNSAGRFSATGEPLALELYKEMDDEMRMSFVGPMPVKQFFQAFLPKPRKNPVATSNELGGFEKMSEAGLESDMYDEFVTVVNSLCTVLKAYNTSGSVGIESGARYKPDVTFYDTGISLPNGPVTCFQLMEIFVEFKRGNTSDPFYEGEGDPFSKPFDAVCISRGQMVLYATRLQMYQFRTFVFSVGIFGKVARLFRWDRSGAVVSSPIKYSEKGNRELSEFFYRLNWTDRTGRGFDPTVTDATPEQSADFFKAIRTAVGEGEERKQLLENLLDSVGNGAEYPRKRVDILDPSGMQKSYIVGRSLVTPASPTGRCTRGFVAVEVGTRRLVFLKDSWRPDISGVRSEPHWYKRLQGAQNIAAFLHGSDVGVMVRKKVKATGGTKPGFRSQRTRTQNYAKKYRHIADMTGYIHCRIVQCEFYVPLTEFQDSRHLTKIMYDVLLAIEGLFGKGVLHRDISVNNIMITIHGQGRLIDFDLAREVNYLGARQSIRTGTWQFMSTRLLSTPRKIHDLSDDLESHFLVMLYVALHFVKHDKPSGLNMQAIFDQGCISQKTGNHRGGVGKAYMYDEGLLVEFASEQFTCLIRAIFDLFSAFRRYHTRTARGVSPSQASDSAVKALEDCREIKRYFVEALDRTGWPASCDKVQDQYVPKNRLTRKQKETVALSHLHRKLNFTGKSSGKRKREDDDDVLPHPMQLRAKR